MNILETLAKELNITLTQVEKTVELIDEGNTIPFIARYRKEVTGSLDDEILRKFEERLNYLRNIEKRREEVTELIRAQDKLTPEIEEAIKNAVTITEIDDIYRPFRPHRKTRASVAKEKGLEPLALLILEQRSMVATSNICGSDKILFGRVKFSLDNTFCASGESNPPQTLGLLSEQPSTINMLKFSAPRAN